MNTSINDSFKYQGIATLSLKIGDKTVVKSVHNEGTPQLKRAFAMFMCGGMVADEAKRYIPTRLDLRVDNFTALKKAVLITNPSYYKEDFNSEVTWYVEYSAVIPFSSLINPIDIAKNYRFYLMCDNGKDNWDESNDIAYISVPGNDLKGLQSGVSVLVSWRLKILNNVPSN